MTDEEVTACIQRHAREFGLWLGQHYPDPATWDERWVVEQALLRRDALLAEIGQSIEYDAQHAFTWGQLFQTVLLTTVKKTLGTAR